MLRDLIDRRKVLVLDGGLATRLEDLGCDLDDPLWSAKILLEQPEFIRRVHLDYYRAGADVAVTASYQASIEGFERQGLSEAQAGSLIQSSVRLAREARDMFLETGEENRSRPLIVGSVGSYGAYLADGSEYRGQFDLDHDRLKAFHRPRMSLLHEAGVDLLAMETIPCREEAEALVSLLKEFPGLRAWVSFSARDEVHTSQGEPMTKVAAALHEHDQVEAVGVNCTNPKFIESLIHAVRAGTDKPVVVYPNSGETWCAQTHTWGGDGSNIFPDALLDRWYAAGARLIGGCCRTGPETISAIAAWRRGL
ncbi:MAG: homocysteine S-methyltransferase [Acidobacteriota bacterium]|nr:homocysteine S-methyltransferase [Acidobacteriota bacterium]